MPECLAVLDAQIPAARRSPSLLIEVLDQAGDDLSGRSHIAGHLLVRQVHDLAFPLFALLKQEDGEAAVS